MLPRLNPVLPFEDPTSLEFLSEKNDASLVLVGSHSKKRPHNLVLVRVFALRVGGWLLQEGAPSANLQDVIVPACIPSLLWSPQGRFFNYKVLDLVELGVTGFTAAADIKVRWP